MTLVEPPSPQVAPLYARVLGDAWERLPKAIRAAHFRGTPIRRRGTFAVRRGSNVFSRCMAAVMRLPAAGDAVAIELTIAADGDGERWLRRFDGRPLVTTQHAAPRNELCERATIIEFYFRLECVDGALVYRQTAARLRLGPLSLPLPRRMAPQVGASETAAAEGRVAISVSVALPLVGQVITYAGSHGPEEGA